MNCTKAVFVLALISAMAACSESPQETASDVAEAKLEAAKDVAQANSDATQRVADAQAKLDVAAAEGQAAMQSNADAVSVDLNAARADMTREQAQANYDLSVVNAEAELKVAKERCDALEGDQKKLCVDTAGAMRDSAVAMAKSTLNSYIEAADKLQNK